MFAQRAGYGFSICRRIDAGRTMFSDEHMNPYTILQGAQLLERFRLLQWCWFPFHELQKHLAAEAVDTLMTEKQ